MGSPPEGQREVFPRKKKDESSQLNDKSSKQE